MDSPAESRGCRILLQHLNAAGACLDSLEQSMVMASGQHRDRLSKLHRSARLSHARCTSFLLTYLQYRFFTKSAAGFREDIPILMGQSRSVGATASLLANKGKVIPGTMANTRAKWAGFVSGLRRLSQCMTEATTDDGLLNLREDS